MNGLVVAVHGIAEFHSEVQAMKLPLERQTEPKYKPYGSNAVALWTSSEPFVENKRGILIHRPRRVTLYNWKERWGPHIAVEYYCGQTTTDRKGNITFLPAPAETDLLCEACEARAVMAGLPSASELAGRHVHIGKLKAVRVCCAQEDV